MFEKIHGVYENHLHNSGRRGPYLHTGYILFQLLRLLGRDVKAEEFNTLNSAMLPGIVLQTKTLELAITNDRIWHKVCAALGWKYLPTV